MRNNEQVYVTWRNAQGAIETRSYDSAAQAIRAFEQMTMFAPRLNISDLIGYVIDNDRRSTLVSWDKHERRPPIPARREGRVVLSLERRWEM